MSKTYRVRYDPAAVVALEESARYIAEDSGPGRAESWLRALREGIEKLETHPRAYPVASTVRGRVVHSKLVISHRVFYIVDEAASVVYVIDIVHTARDSRLSEYREGS